MYFQKTILLTLLFAVFFFPLIPTSHSSRPSTNAFFVTAYIGDTQQIETSSKGDLWPSCWSDDDNLYTANGDGEGFAKDGSDDVVVNRISGGLGSLFGAALAKGARVGSIWGPNAANYNRKPTGMICVNGNIYIAIQNLNRTPENAFKDADSASISKSMDHGTTWVWDITKPMFSDHKFTTIFFCNYTGVVEERQGGK